jgi:acetyl-CoA synthetase (ADP-forming)
MYCIALVFCFASFLFDTPLFTAYNPLLLNRIGQSMNLISEALARGQSALSEHESRRFLSLFGIPVVHEALAPDADSAVDQAGRIGYPIALKASGKNLLHKSEVRGVVLNLRSPGEIKKEGQRLLEIPGCEALLVQEMIHGHREFVCGLTRDAQFGPCVMFGLGGVLTEVLDDVAFRLAPLNRWDAQEMMAEIRSKKLIEPFRGESAVDRDMLAQTLVALGRIGVEYEEIREIDINPMKIRSDGRPVSVDALVVLEANK